MYMSAVLFPRTPSSLSPIPSRPHLVSPSRRAPIACSSNLEIIGARRSLLSKLRSLQKPYTPFPVIGWNGDVETLFVSFFRSSPAVRLRRQCLRMKDGGVVALDWAFEEGNGLPFDAPVLVLVPGLTAGSDSSYVKHMVAQAQGREWHVVVSNHRGCANSPVTTPKFYSASSTEDLREVIDFVKRRYHKSKIYAIGWSLGANILVRYLGQESGDCLVSGAASLCNPFNLVIANKDFEGSIYDNLIANSLTATLEKHSLLFEGIGGKYNIQLAANAQSVREFDEGLTHVSFGFESVDDYYSNASCCHIVKDVRRPLLCIQAANDPIAPSRAIPREEINKNPYCILIVTPQGGHVGWVAGDGAPYGAPWTDTVVLEFLQYLEKDGGAFSPAR